MSAPRIVSEQNSGCIVRRVLNNTVLISYFNDPQNANVRCDLTYRVSNTTVKELREQVIQYWNIAFPDEYILKTIGGSKVSEDLDVTECFKDGEIAHLFLVRKTPQSSIVSEAEKKAIQPKKPKVKGLQQNTTISEETINAIGPTIEEQMR